MTSERILCVDDEPQLLSGLRRVLHGRFGIDLALRPEDGLEMLQREDYAVVVSDMRMPGMDGVEFLAQARRLSPSTVRIMLTGNADQATAALAVNRGEVFRFLSKPCPPDVFAAALQGALDQHRLLKAERELLESTLKGSVRVLCEILALVDPEAFGRSTQLRDGAGELARTLGLAPTWEIEIAAMLLELGSVTVPQDLRRKVEAGQELEPDESAMLARVPEVGYELLQHVPRLEGVAQIVRTIDSSSPDRPVGARILAPLRELLRREKLGSPTLQAWIETRKQLPIEDPAVLEALNAWVQARVRAAGGLRDSVTPIPFSKLHAGHVLAAALEMSDGRRLVAEDQLITALTMERIRNHARGVGVREPIWIYGTGTLSDTPGASAGDSTHPGA